MPLPERIVALLAEDNPDDVVLLRRALERIGRFEPVLVLPDPEQAIPYLRGENGFADRTAYPLPEVLLMDAKMPRVSGIDLLFWLRTEPKWVRLPVVILSGALSPAQEEIIQRLNATWCLKGVEMRQMSALIDDAVRRAFSLVACTDSSAPR